VLDSSFVRSLHPSTQPKAVRSLAAVYLLTPTLEDTVEFFNLVTGAQLTEQGKTDLVAFMRAL
jgi:hypothetical protein